MRTRLCRIRNDLFGNKAIFFVLSSFFYVLTTLFPSIPFTFFEDSVTLQLKKVCLIEVSCFCWHGKNPSRREQYSSTLLTLIVNRPLGTVRTQLSLPTMKRILTFALLLLTNLGATSLFAQSSLLATLSHEGDISTFYGATALREAHEAAVDGDIITLSSGTFNSVNLTKGITLRGAGMDVDATTQSEPTIITGDFEVNIPKTATSPLTIEGIYSDYKMYVTDTLRNATFLKSRFKKIDSKNSKYPFINMTIIHCKVTEVLYAVKLSTINCINCVIWNPYCCDGYESVFEMTNCVVCKGNVGSTLYASTFKNCIFIGNDGGNNFFNYTYGPNAIYNCVGVDDNTNHKFFQRVQNATNKMDVYTNVFKTCKNGTYSDSETFELADFAPETFKGTDGTQVGIYGGSMPFSITPSNPQITKCNVAAKSTPDGKLSVDITVQGAE